MHAVLEQISKIGLVPVIKLDDPDKAVDLATALKKGGIPVAEVTFRAEGADRAIAAIAKPQGGAPLAPEAGQKQKPGKPSKKDILGIEDKKERMAAIAANIDLFK